MRKNILKCPEYDYDFYTIPLPVKLLFGRKRKSFIYSQMEKLHPCFSNDYSFDSHLHLEKSGLKAQVVVMPKYKIAEYKAGNKKLFFKECKGYQFFSENKKNKWMLPLIMILILIITLAGIKRKASQKEILIPQEECLDLPVSTRIEEDYRIIDFLLFLQKEGAEVNFLNWSYDGYTEKFSMLLTALYPETVQTFSQDLELSPVSFKDSLPQMTVSLNKQLLQSADSSCEYNLFKNDFRKMLIQNNVTLVEESVKPYGVKLSISQNQPASYKEIFIFLQKNQISLSQIIINSSEIFLNIDLTFAPYKLQSQENLFEALSDKRIFVSRQKKYLPQKNSEEKERKGPEPQIKGNKLGQIIRTDGSVLSFYKDENGKIIWR